MIAALLVFLHHFHFDYGVVTGRVLHSISVEGHVGVTIFFVLSGFLITYRYYPDFQNRRFSVREFVIKRIARIYPLYFVVLALTLYITYDELFPYPRSAVYWTLTQSFFVDLKFAGVPTAWSLTVEECFYFAAPFIYLLLWRLSTQYNLTAQLRLILYTVSMIVISVGAFLLGLLIVHVSEDTNIITFARFMDDDVHMIIYTIFGRMFDFAIGIFIGLVYLQWGHKLWNFRFSGIAVTMILILCTWLIMRTQYAMNLEGGILFAWEYLYLVAVLSGIIILSLTHSGTIIYRVMSHPLLLYLGRISFALYILQLTPIVLWLETALHSDHRMYVWLLYVLANVISAGFYELVEKPARSFILKHTLTSPPPILAPQTNS